MRQNSAQQTIHIQEPTFKEIKKHHGWLTGSLTTGCGCIVFFLGALYIVFRIVVGSGPAVVANFPADFPKDIPQSNPDKIVKIVVVEATNKQRALWVATTIPRYIAAPILTEIDPNAEIFEETDSLGRVDFRRELRAADFARVAGLPTSSENTKTVSVVWTGVKTSPTVAAENYAKQLEHSGYKISEPLKQLPNEATFTFEKNDVSGVYRAVDLHPEKQSTEFIQLIVNY